MTDISELGESVENLEYTSNGSSIWLAIWNDIKTGGIELYVFGLLVLLYVLRKPIIEFLTFMFKKITKKYRSEAKEYTKKDVLNHSLFKDLEFWLTIGIKSIRFNNLPVHFPNIKHNNEAEDYIKAKEEIAKDILQIKFEAMEDFIKTFLKDNDLEFSELEVIKKYLTTSFLRYKMTQQTKMMDAGIPKPFLTKYIILERVSDDMMLYSFETILDEKAFDLNIYSRVYMIFNVIDSYLNEIFNNIAHTVTAINGDLNGMEYKGKIIGVKRTTILQPPHPTYVMNCREYLTKMAHKYHTSRIYVMRYFDNKDGNLTHSCVYEVCNNGITSEIANIQNVSGGDEDMIALLKSGTIIATESNKFNSYLANRFINRGCMAVLVAPIFEEEKLIGVLFMEYTDLGTFENFVDINKIDDDIKKACADLKQYITYPSNYEFQS